MPWAFIVCLSIAQRRVIQALLGIQSYELHVFIPISTFLSHILFNVVLCRFFFMPPFY